MESNSESQLFHCFMHWLSLTTTQNFSLCFLLPTICRRVQNTIDCTTYSLIFFVYLKSVLQKKISVFKQHIFVLTKTHNWKSALHTHTHTHTNTHIYIRCVLHICIQSHKGGLQDVLNRFLNHYRRPLCSLNNGCLFWWRVITEQLSKTLNSGSYDIWVFKFCVKVKIYSLVAQNVSNRELRR